ncbi:ion transporter [Sphaerisporangium dianthi]|uniref:Ion transporter n=1 Tax=Sphaerisporangium dianthi TaxID=1436120 RepID=A0ABV9CC87_9ACTN
MRDRVRHVLESTWFQRAIISVIVVNAATLGVETSAEATASYGALLHVVDHAALYVFVAELLAKVYVYRARFVLDPWNLFDTVIVVVSFLPTAGGLSVLRALRIMRALRLISVVPSLRRVVAALLTAVPGMTSIAVLLGLVLYVASVMATKLYGATAPEYFGDLPTSLFTLFQTMTGDGWSDINRRIMEQHPSSWVFFVVFVLICTFVVLNLFIAVVVSAMEEEHQREREQDGEAAGPAVAVRSGEAGPGTGTGHGPGAGDGGADVAAELAALRAEIAALREALPGVVAVPADEVLPAREDAATLR